MRLASRTLTLQEQLEEFDIWITPSLGEIRDTERFKQELERVAAVFEALSLATGGFEGMDACKPAAIASTYVEIARASGEAEARFADLASTLFLVSGKSDNNAKCQLPIFLRDQMRFDGFPKLSRERIISGPIPRELKADKYMAAVASLAANPEAQTRLLEAFVGFVLSDEGHVAQLWSVGRSFVAMKTFGRERDLITPLVTFQVRGSVAASGGHVPEERLRSYMMEWGLVPGKEFNITDAAVTREGRAVEEDVPLPPDTNRQKTRAYDFVLPFRVPGRKPRLLVQSQFYAGDSGSVSHKNVDQTTTSRRAAQEILPESRFVEYVDGAGYFSSLNGDLKTLLAMPNTRSFFQLRSAPIRLRRELQEIGFLTPLDVAHASLAAKGDPVALEQRLLGDGYSALETERGLARALEVGMLVTNGKRRDVAAVRRETVRRYLLLDIAASFGDKVEATDQLKGKLLVPGFGPFHGLALDQLAARALAFAPALAQDWGSPEVILRDIRWLCERGFAMAG